VFERQSRALVDEPLHAHVPALYQAERGGRLALSFAEFYVSIVQYRPGAAADALTADLGEAAPELFSFAKHWDAFDYLLIRARPEALGNLLGERASDLDVRSSGGWHLVQRRRSAGP
jgi:hypothetical protein